MNIQIQREKVFSKTRNVDFKYLHLTWSVYGPIYLAIILTFNKCFISLILNEANLLWKSIFDSVLICSCHWKRCGWSFKCFNIHLNEWKLKFSKYISFGKDFDFALIFSNELLEQYSGWIYCVAKWCRKFNYKYTR